MKVISQLDYTQPSGTRIRLIEREVGAGLFGHPYTAERFVGAWAGFEVQEGWYGWPRKTAESMMMRWRHFEERLQLEGSLESE